MELTKTCRVPAAGSVIYVTKSDRNQLKKRQRNVTSARNTTVHLLISPLRTKTGFTHNKHPLVANADIRKR